MEHTTAVRAVEAVPEATFGFSAADSPEPGDLQLTPVSPLAWRVTDGRLPADDPFRLLAFVELRGDEFEVMQLGGRFEWHRFGTLSAALAFVCASGPKAARERLAGDLAWIA